MNAIFRHLWPLGIRLQLMLWYTAVFAALLLFVGAIFYQHLEHALEASLDTTLEIRAQQIVGGIVISNGTISRGMSRVLRMVVTAPAGSRPRPQ